MKYSASHFVNPDEKSYFQRFYRYHELMSQKALQQKKRDNTGAMPRTPFFAVFKKCWPQCLNVFMVFFVTLSLFPAVQSGRPNESSTVLCFNSSVYLFMLNDMLLCIVIIPVFVADIKRSDPNFFLEERFYDSVLCYITFNVCAMIGSSLSTWIRWVSSNSIMVLFYFFILLLSTLEPCTIFSTFTAWPKISHSCSMVTCPFHSPVCILQLFAQRTGQVVPCDN